MSCADLSEMPLLLWLDLWGSANRSWHHLFVLLPRDAPWLWSRRHRYHLSLMCSPSCSVVVVLGERLFKFCGFVTVCIKSLFLPSLSYFVFSVLTRSLILLSSFCAAR